MQKILIILVIFTALTGCYREEYTNTSNALITEELVRS
ncbi:MAG: hypothetical protein K0R98_1212 [Rickettsiaceae bacterium]|nr:hypothetical protein [Rickettsiaceae bacterium]